MSQIQEYILSFITFDNKHLNAINEQERHRNDIQPSVGAEVGKLISYP